MLDHSGARLLGCSAAPALDRCVTLPLRWSAAPMLFLSRAREAEQPSAGQNGHRSKCSGSSLLGHFAARAGRCSSSPVLGYCGALSVRCSVCPALGRSASVLLRRSASLLLDINGARRLRRPSSRMLDLCSARPDQCSTTLALGCLTAPALGVFGARPVRRAAVSALGRCDARHLYLINLFAA